MSRSHCSTVHPVHDPHLQSKEKALECHMLEVEELDYYFRASKVGEPRVECDEDPEQNY